MTTINQQMGLPRAGKRSMMKLPKKLEDRVRLTSAICPECSRTGARALRSKGPAWVFCTWCSHAWELPA